MRAQHTHRRIATANGIEHDHMAVRRRASGIRVCLSEASFLRLASALATERNEAWLTRRYVNFHQQVLTTERVMAAG